MVCSEICHWPRALHLSQKFSNLHVLRETEIVMFGHVIKQPGFPQNPLKCVKWEPEHWGLLITLESLRKEAAAVLVVIRIGEKKWWFVQSSFFERE